jgi:hypothetical protein
MGYHIITFTFGWVLANKYHAVKPPSRTPEVYEIMQWQESVPQTMQRTSNPGMVAQLVHNRHDS